MKVCIADSPALARPRAHFPGPDANERRDVADVLPVMLNLTTNPGSDAQWRALVGEAEASTGCVLGERLETYLIHLLIRVSTRADLCEGLLALDQLIGRSPLKPRADHLRDIGDQCLLFAGLFPDLAEERGVRLGQFVSLGQTAYRQLHELLQDESRALFADLSLAFTTLLDLLHTMRELRDHEAALTPLHAFDLWWDTGSLRALRYIRASTGAFPVRHSPGDSTLPM